MPPPRHVLSSQRACIAVSSVAPQLPSGARSPAVPAVPTDKSDERQPCVFSLRRPTNRNTPDRTRTRGSARTHRILSEKECGDARGNAPSEQRLSVDGVIVEQRRRPWERQRAEEAAHVIHRPIADLRQAGTRLCACSRMADAARASLDRACVLRAAYCEQCNTPATSLQPLSSCPLAATRAHTPHRLRSRVHSRGPVAALGLNFGGGTVPIETQIPTSARCRGDRAGAQARHAPASCWATSGAHVVPPARVLRVPGHARPAAARAS